MTLKTSLLITGDASAAIAAADSLKAHLQTLPPQITKAEHGFNALQGATGEWIVTANKAAGAVADAGKAMSGVGGAAKTAQDALSNVASAMNDNEGQARANAFGLRNLGQQFGDLAVMVQGGIDPIRAFGTQAGQMGYALSEMSGKAGAVGAFLTGPWGIALTIAVTTLAPFVEKLFQGADGADKFKDQTLTLTEALGKQAFGTDAARKAIDDYNQAQHKATEQDSLATDRSIRLAEARLKEAGATIAATKARIAKVTAEKDEPDDGTGSGFVAGAAKTAALGSLANLLKSQEKDGAAVEQALRGLYVQRGKVTAGAAADPIKALNLQYDRMRDRAIRAAEGNTTLARAVDGTLAAIEKQRAAALDNQRAAGGGAKAAGSLADAEARLATASTETGKAQAQLTIVRRESEAAVKAGTLTQDEANTKIREARAAVEAAREADRSHAEARRDQAKATNEAIAAERQWLALLDSLKAKYDPAAAANEQYAATIRDIWQAQAEGRIDAATAAQYGSAALLSKRQSDLRRGDDAWKSATGVDAATELKNVTGGLSGAVVDGAREGADLLKGGITAAWKTVGADIASLIGGKAGGAIGKGISGLGATSGLFAKSGVASKNSAALEAAIQHIGGPNGLKLNASFVDGFASRAGKAFAGAQTGEFANSLLAPLGKLIGVKTSKTGAEIGGAVGNLLPIPGGSIIGSIAGSLLGGLLKTSKNGGATIAADGTITGSGNSASRIAAASKAAGSIQEGLAAIAAQLGGTVGYLSPITIGTYGKNNEYRVNTTGGTTLGGSKSALSGVAYFGSGDEGAAAALAYAIKLEVERGAVTGLSAAVQKAIASTPDIDKGVAEALKVSEVEMSLKGLSGAMEKVFRDQERTAKERLRIATQYGFDVLAIEKRNADDRAKLAEQLQKQQTGSLQKLIDDMTSGSLFEGTALDKIAALDTSIAKAKTDLAGGVDGAGDTLADLLGQKLAAFKDAYGTADGYATGRAAILDEARGAIAASNAKIAAAEKVSDPALATTNAALDENNDQNAKIIAALEANNVLLGKLATGIGAGSRLDLSSLAAV